MKSRKATKFAAECDNCGIVYDDGIDVDFPHGATCNGCGEDLAPVRALEEEYEVVARV